MHLLFYVSCERADLRDGKEQVPGKILSVAIGSPRSCPVGLRRLRSAYHYPGATAEKKQNDPLPSGPKRLRGDDDSRLSCEGVPPYTLVQLCSATRAVGNLGARLLDPAPPPEEQRGPADKHTANNLAAITCLAVRCH